MAVISNFKALRNFAFKKLTTEIRGILASANARLPKSRSVRQRRCFLVIEAFLQISKQDINVEMLSTPAMSEIIMGVIGAILNGKLLNGSEQRSNDYARHLGGLHDQLFIQKGKNPKISLRQVMGRYSCALRQQCVNSTKYSSWDEAACRLWQGWTLQNESYSTNLDLYEIHEKYGQQYTFRLYEACQAYYSERIVQRIPGMESFTTFLSSSHCNYTLDDFANSEMSIPFLEELASFHIQLCLGKVESGKKQVSSHTLTIDWNNHFRTLVCDYFYPRNVIAPHRLGLLFPNDIVGIVNTETTKLNKAKTKTRRNLAGKLEKHKALTPVPVDLTTDEAVTQLLQQIKDDLELVLHWAQIKIKETDLRLDEIDEIYCTEKCNVPSQKKSNLSPVLLASERINSARIYKEQGFSPKRDFYTNCISPSYNLAASDLTDWLCLPKAELFIPHIIFLAARNQGITNSFLDKLELFNIRGEPDGYPSRHNLKLVGMKGRKNKDHGSHSQSLNITEDSLQVIDSVTRLTSPVRAYLVKNHDPLAKHLFISTGKGLGNPNKIRSTSLTGTSLQKNLTARSMQRILGISREHAERLAGDMSVNSVRVSSTILEVVSHMNLTIASDNLDHIYFDLRLLERYIPKQILVYLMRREIFNWNTITLVQALGANSKSANLIGFESTDKLQTFLDKHISHIADQNETTLTKPTTSIITIGVDDVLVALLVSIELAVYEDPEGATAFGIYWAGFCGGLRSWIHSTENYDADLRDIFEEGSQLADIELVRGATHG